MLPILGADDPEQARGPARELGFAFQLTNFIRDVAEDRERGRVNLPHEDLARFDLQPADLRPGNPGVKPLIAYEVSRARRHYAFAAPGIPLLEPASQACMRTAYQLYGGILDEVEAAGYDVFAKRATVPNSRRASVAVRSLLTRPGTPVRS
jgi:phytoene synthase